MTRDLITVMITVFDNDPYLGEAIESVLGQSYDSVELIVVDDGSTDRSGAIAESYAGVTVLHQPRGGIAVARNRALELATGALLGFLDADDRMVSTAVATLAGAFDEQPTLDIAYAHVREFHSDDLSDERRARLRPPAERIPGRLPTTMLARRAVFDRVGPFTTGIRRGIGIDWSARADELPFSTTMLPDVLFERRLHDENNGLREQASTNDYIRVVKAALDRRRAAGPGST